ncbi:MAG: hypothetical protein ABJE10_19105 [bacterium]
MNYGVSITSPNNGASIGYNTPLTVSGSYGNFLPAGGTIRQLRVDVTFGATGPTVGVALDPMHSGTWQVTGTPVAKGTESFTITATTSGKFDQPADGVFGALLDTASAGIFVSVIDALAPTIAVNGFPDNVQATLQSATFPAAYTLSGTVSDADSNIALVQVTLNNGQPQLANNISGDWRQWSLAFSLPAGQHSFTVHTLDLGGHPAQQVRLLTVTAPVAPPPPPPPPIPGAPSITSWNRLEPHTTEADIGVSSMARVFDPLWMLTRQWQVGEFQGEDAGTPVKARVRATSATLSRCYLGTLPSTAIPPAPKYDPTTMPLEVMVERRPSRATSVTDPRMLGLSVEAALHFLRMLEVQALTQYRAVFITKFALQQPSNIVLADMDEAARRFVQSMIGRAPDARLLVASFRSVAANPVTIDPTLGVAAADLPKVQQVAQAWLTWYDTLLSEPVVASNDPWNASRLEYSVSVAARLSATANDEVALSATEFDDGQFDWSNFDVDQQAKLGTTGDATFKSIAETTIPSPVTFRGSPAMRFWEMEEGRVAYGLMTAGPTDLAHLMMIEYASTYGNDWYSVPLTIPVGSVTRVESLVVTDSFGVQSLLRPIGDSTLPKPYWSMWQQSLLPSQAAAAPTPYATNRFFFPPSIGHVIDGTAVEDVLFMRDEMANLAWAIERQLESPLEQAITQTSDRAGQGSIVSLPVAADKPHYRLSSTVPDNWIPYLPVQIPNASGPVQTRLRRGAVLQPDGTGVSHPAKSQLLAGSPQIYDEEVPREGVHISRARRMSRWIDGSTWVWTAFQREVGRGEGSSGLAFDQLVPPDGSAPPLTGSLTTLTAPTITPTTLAVNGAAGTFSVTIDNAGAILSNVTLQASVVQGAARRSVASALVDCGSGAGIIPIGRSTATGPLAVSSTGSGVGALAFGAATIELQLNQGSNVLATSSISAPVTLSVGGSPSIAAVTNPSAVMIDGVSGSYAATLTNPGAALSNAALQCWVVQGTARRSASTALDAFAPGIAAGTLPIGTFNVTGGVLTGNAASGTGTIVPGPAVLQFELTVAGAVVTTKAVPVTLVPLVGNPAI